MKVRQLITALKKAKKNAEVYFYDGDAVFTPILAYSSSPFAENNPVNKHDEEFWLDITGTPYPNAPGVTPPFQILGFPAVPVSKNITVIGPVKKKEQRHKRHLPVIQHTSWTILDRAMTKVKTEKDVPEGPVLHERGKML